MKPFNYLIFQFRSKSKLFILISSTAVVLAALGFGYYLHERKNTQRVKYNELHAIARLKMKQVSMWYEVVLSDVQLFSERMPFRGYAADILNGKSGNEEPFREACTHLITRAQYDNIYLLDLREQLKYSTVANQEIPDPSISDFVTKALEERKIVFTDFYYCQIHRKVNFDLLAPVLDALGEPLGVMVFSVSPSLFLYPLIQEWPTPARTAETVIAKQIGDSIHYLNELKNYPNSELKLTIPANQFINTTTQAAAGHRGLYEGPDYAGIRVLSDLNFIPELNWYMIVKVSTGEIYAEFNKRAGLISFVTILAILLFGAAVAWFYYIRQRNIFRELYQKNADLVKSQEEFGTTLYSIGDGVIITDTSGMIRHLNPAAERYTGWEEKDSIGKKIEEVFQILNEETGEKIDNPVKRILQEGNVVGFSNHTLLISRTGNEIPIGSNGAPIKDQSGKILGVVVVFNDQTTREFRRKVTEIRVRLLESGIKLSLNEILSKTVDEICSVTHSPIGFFHLLTDDEKNIATEIWSIPPQEKKLQADCTVANLKPSMTKAWTDCIRLRKPVIHNSEELSRIFFLTPNGPVRIIRSMYIPVFRYQKIVAVLGLGNKSSDYTQSDIELIDFLSDVIWEIVEHRLKEDQMKASEERFEHLFERAPLGYQSLDENGCFVEVNQAWLDIFGYQTKEEVVGKWFGDFLPSENIPIFLEKFGTFKGVGKIHSEYEMLTKSGEKKMIAFDGRIGYTKDGSFEKTHCILNDITKQKETELKLQENEELFRLILNNSLDAILLTKPDGTTLSANDAACQMFGMTEDEIRALGRNGLVDQTDPRLEFLLEKRKQEGKVKGELTFIRKNGEKFPTEISSSLFLDSKGEVFSGMIIHDISVRKQKELALLHSEETIRMLFDSTAEGILYLNINGICTFCNKAALNLLGYQNEAEIVGRELHPLIMPVDSHDVKTPLKCCRICDSVKTGTFVHADNEMFHKKNGVPFHVEYWAYPILKEGNCSGSVITFMDITQRKRDEAVEQILYEIALRSQEIKTIEELLCLIRGEIGKVLDASAFIMVLFHPGTRTYKRMEFKGDDLFVTEHDTEKSLAGLVFKTGKTIHIKNSQITETLLEHGIEMPGEPPKSWVGVPLPDEKGTMGVMILKSWKDSTAFSSGDIKLLEMVAHELTHVIRRTRMIEDLVAAKEKAEESDRLKSAFLANVSHEIRTPMNGILGFLELLNDRELNEEQRELYMNVITQSGQRLLSTINDIVEIAKIESGQIELHLSNINSTELMTYYRDFFKKQAADKNITLNLGPHVTGEPAVIRTDRYKLECILTNLLNNAVKFTIKGGIEFGNYIRGESLVFYVKDSGIGIPPEKFDTIFQRFVQADLGMSRAYEGSGLGLAIVKAYVDIMNGQVWLESEPGKGSTFYFSIPVDPNQHKMGQVSSMAEIQEVKQKKSPVLIVEDDDIVFLYLQTILKGHVSEIIHRKNGLDAVQAVKEIPGLSLVLMDIRLPGINGLEATREIRKFNPNIPIIAQTAYAMAGDRDKALDAGCNEYIQKPINRHKLLALIEKFNTHERMETDPV